MTIRNEDVCIWYSSLKPASRIEFLSGFLRLLLPWELRFIGSCLEDLARRDFHVFRESEQRANNLSVMQRISSLHSFTSDEFRALLAVSLALLHSTNVQCATLYSDVLLWNFELARELVRYDEVSRQDIILLYHMAINHPAFTFDQRQTLCDCLRILQQIEKESTFISAGHQQAQNDSYHRKMPIEYDSRVLRITLMRSERNDDPTKPTYQYLFQVIWTNGDVTEVWKSLTAFCHFHDKLTTYVMHHENVGGYHLPELQMQQLHQSEVPEVILPELLKYVECLTNMPLHILHSTEVTEFFASSGDNVCECTHSICRQATSNEKAMTGMDLDPFMTRTLQPLSPPSTVLATPSSTPSCSPSHISFSFESSSSSLDMPRHSSTGSSPLSTPPSSSDGRNAPRLREEAFTEDKFCDVIDLTKSTDRLHLHENNKTFKYKQPSTMVTEHKRPSWLNRTCTIGTNHRPGYSISSLGDGSGSETRVHNSTHSRPSVSSSSSLTTYQLRLAAWLKANRMHKYLDRLRKYSYEELLRIDRPQLQREGFTQGAINKLLGMQEELVRNPQSFYSPQPVASASHRSSSDSSTSTSSPASPSPPGVAAPLAEDGVEEEKKAEAKEPEEQRTEEEEEEGEEDKEGPAVATVQPLIQPPMYYMPYPSQVTPTAPQPVLYPPTPQTGGDIPRPAAHPNYLYYHMPPSHTPATRPPTSSPQPVLLLRPGPAAMQVGSSVFPQVPCSCPFCQQQSPAPPQQPPRQPPHNFMWPPNGMLLTCPGVSYPYCPQEHAAAQPMASATPNVGYVHPSPAPMMPFNPNQQAHYFPAQSGYGFYPACYPANQTAGLPSGPIRNRALTCYNCGVPGHKSAECQEKTIDCLMSESYFHLKYQPAESFCGPASRSSPNTPTGGQSLSLEL